MTDTNNEPMGEIHKAIAAAYEEQIISQLNQMSIIDDKLFGKRTQEEKAEGRRKHAAKLVEARLSIDKYLALEDEIAKLHAPKASVLIFLYPDCEGCDPGSYSESAAEWPCRTAVIIMKRNFISMEAWGAIG